MKRVIGLFVVLVLIVIGGMMAYFGDSPQELWERGQDVIAGRAEPEAPLERTPTLPATETTPELLTNTDSPMSVTGETPTPEKEEHLQSATEVDPLVWLQDHPRYMPREVTLNADQRVYLDGESGASESWYEIHAGNTGHVVQVKSKTVILRFGANQLEVPLDETDLKELAVGAVAQAKMYLATRADAPSTVEPEREPPLVPVHLQKRDDVYVWNESPR